MNSLREFDITYVKGIGPRRAELLKKELGIATAYDLLHHFPTHYVDRSKIYRVADFEGVMPSVQVRGRFLTFNEVGEGAKKRLVGLFNDGSAMLEVVWFRSIRTIKKMYLTGQEYILFGKPVYYEPGRTWSMAHPEIDAAGKPNAGKGLRGVYPLTDKLRNAGISSRTFHDWITGFLAGRTTKLSDPLPKWLTDRYKLMSEHQAIIAVHNPPDPATLELARNRLKLEELLLLQLDLRRRTLGRKTLSQGRKFARVGNFFNRFYRERLPFELTDAQKRVIREVRADVNTGRQMNRLVQGDVGSGKTLVALMCMLLAVDNGTQACLMAPTEILAAQHYESLRQLVAPIGINVQLLTGSTRTARRREVLDGIADGSIQILVGTHALIEEKVQFKCLGMAVIDEQHRFGVAQRARLWQKNEIPPHVLVMTATPIPRTLAMTVYGDLDVSVIDELPPGRKPVATYLRYEEQRDNVMRALGAQLRAGRQAYIVHPLIEDNPKLTLRSLEQGYDDITEIFGKYYNIAFVHGKMPQKEKDYQMDLFASGKAQILVATTVIEVGVNVPNASVMIIENAERFGLSQLHQLRGRVGRGSDKSYCVLMSKHKIAKETRERLELMTQTTDGFVIAEADMRMRGPGDIDGTLQSGQAFDLRIANLATDGPAIGIARSIADEILDADPQLRSPENRALCKAVALAYPETISWSKIS